ncbi:hypothetical protein PoB_000839100 [Plakobranchus ocellatus]|uniref:HTH psq-type domain-containing protein n=1 Tax=Plakobranchus ocellatus TaxID=259542 RepID=A0AAV3YFB8_9GAST|nr:hypothetical protein PoB_000839100 [Plakobranchus ocellatus]
MPVEIGARGFVGSSAYDKQTLHRWQKENKSPEINMPRNEVRKTDRGTFESDDMKAAVHAVVEHGQSIRKVAKDFNLKRKKRQKIQRQYATRSHM